MGVLRCPGHQKHFILIYFVYCSILGYWTAGQRPTEYDMGDRYINKVSETIVTVNLAHEGSAVGCKQFPI